MCACVCVFVHVYGVNVWFVAVYSACMGMWLVDLNYLLICSLVRHMFKEVRMTSVTMARRLQEQRTGNLL